VAPGACRATGSSDISRHPAYAEDDRWFQTGCRLGNTEG
jgi:hypothetical protein